MLSGLAALYGLTLQSPCSPEGSVAFVAGFLLHALSVQKGCLEHQGGGCHWYSQSCFPLCSQ